jgi:hypothetical protein
MVVMNVHILNKRNMNTENNKNRQYTRVEKIPIVKKTSTSDKIVLNNLFNTVIQKIKDKHLG